MTFLWCIFFLQTLFTVHLKTSNIHKVHELINLLLSSNDPTNYSIDTYHSSVAVRNLFYSHCTAQTPTFAGRFMTRGECLAGHITRTPSLAKSVAARFPEWFLFQKILLVFCCRLSCLASDSEKKVLVSNIKKSRKNGAGKDFPFMDEKAILEGKGARSEEIVFPAKLGPKGKKDGGPCEVRQKLVLLFKSFVITSLVVERTKCSEIRSENLYHAPVALTCINILCLWMILAFLRSCLPAYRWCKEVVVA